MKVELTLKEAAHLDRVVEAIEDSPHIDEHSRKEIKSARRKLQGALERSGARLDEKGRWIVPK